MRPLLVALSAALALSACAPAASRIDPGALGITARDAFVEARSVARSWSEDARLRWLEGDGIDASGTAPAGEGLWRFHFTAPDQTRGLVVEVSSLEENSTEGPPTSPPGLIIGDAALGPSWIDSDRALEAISGEGGIGGVESMLLVPTRPNQWIIRLPGGERRVVDATDAGVIGR